MEQKVAVFGGIGRREDIAKDLIGKGWRVAISYRSGGSSEKRVISLVDQYGSKKALGILANISKYQEAEKLMQKVLEDYGRIDTLINLASHFPPLEERQRMGSKGILDSDWEYYNSNFFVARNSALALLNLKNNPANELSVINTSDTEVLGYIRRIIDPYKNIRKSILEISLEDIKEEGIKQLVEDNNDPLKLNPYHLAKRDVVYLTRSLALKYGPKHVRVNAIAPGPISPPQGLTENKHKHVLEKTLLKDRWGGTQAFIDVINYLLTSNFITGTIIPIDAGQDIYNMVIPK
jgi:NAD(P)-dependent dehydrogenase (short-subunit alcohol dehydrogenase family)